MPSVPNDRLVEQFCDYFPQHYVNAGCSTVWYKSSTSPFSSTKACESFHTHFKAVVDSALPNVFVQETAQGKNTK
jgi:hypothetical protein